MDQQESQCVCLNEWPRSGCSVDRMGRVDQATNQFERVRQSNYCSPSLKNSLFLSLGSWLVCSIQEEEELRTASFFYLKQGYNLQCLDVRL